jgi:hypothetical protein
MGIRLVNFKTNPSVYKTISRVRLLHLQTSGPTLVICWFVESIILLERPCKQLRYDARAHVNITQVESTRHSVTQKTLMRIRGIGQARELRRTQGWRKLTAKPEKSPNFHGHLFEAKRH